jgi:hypothetical protein
VTLSQTAAPYAMQATILMEHNWSLELMPFRLDLNWISKTGLKKKIACQPVTAMASGGGVAAAYARTGKHSYQE